MLSELSGTVTQAAVPMPRQSIVVSTTTLNELLYNPSADELAFLRVALGSDTDTIRAHILDVQRE